MLLASLLAGLLQTGRIDAPAQPLLHRGPDTDPGAGSSLTIGRAAMPIVAAVPVPAPAPAPRPTELQPVATPLAAVGSGAATTMPVPAGQGADR